MKAKLDLILAAVRAGLDREGLTHEAGRVLEISAPLEFGFLGFGLGG